MRKTSFEIIPFLLILNIEQTNVHKHTERITDTRLLTVQFLCVSLHIDPIRAIDRSIEVIHSRDAFASQHSTTTFPALILMRKKD